MKNKEESSETVRSTPSGTADDTGNNIVIKKDETLTAKTTRSGDAIIYGIVRGYSPDGHQYDLLSNWEVEYEDDLFEEEEDDDNDDDDDDDKDGQTKYEYLNDREVTEACYFFNSLSKELKEKAYAMFETQSPPQQVELTASEINSEQPNAPEEEFSQGEQTTVEKGEKEGNAKNRSVKVQ